MKIIKCELENLPELQKICRETFLAEENGEILGYLKLNVKSAQTEKDFPSPLSQSEPTRRPTG